jgi:two-component system sensor histidine kinase KdpD
MAMTGQGYESQDSKQLSRQPGNRVARRVRATPPAPRPGARFLDAVAAAQRAGTGWTRVLRYGGTVVALAAVTAALWPVREEIGLLNIGLVFLIAVIGATVFAGRWAGILASVLGFALFDFFLVPPYLTFAIGDLRNILALFVFLGLSTLTSQLIAGAREQAAQAQQRAADVSQLYELSQAITTAERLDQVLPAIAQKVMAVFAAQACWILLPGPHEQLQVAAQAPAPARPLTRDEALLAERAYWYGNEVGLRGALTLDRPFAGPPAASRAAFVPLRAGGHTIGVLVVADKRNHQPLTPAERTVLATFADQAAVALERLRLLREAQRAEVLARTDELKSALMSAVSHDLRTPLASIMASVTSLLEPEITWDAATQRDFLQGIYDEARRLNDLVGNLLDMSRIEGGALQPEKDWYAIEEVIGGVVQRLEPRLAAHPVRVQVEPDLPLLRLDFSEIDQVLTNLVENALKYTLPGTAITITARRAGATVEVTVADNGPGVPAEDLRYLFDKFYRVDKRVRTGGTGLGLAISKGLIEAHGGRIGAHNQPVGGLAVTFTLPLPEATTRYALPRAGAEAAC